MTSSIELRPEPDVGALVLLGPSNGALSELDTLLSLPNVQGVEAIGARMASWLTVSAEVIEVGRAASHAVRAGQTAAVHLDSHVGDAPALSAQSREFVCDRFGQIMIGLADVPSYMVVHGESLARSLLSDSLDDPGAESAGSFEGDCPIWRLSESTMFAGAYVAICSDDRPVSSLVDLLAWFESYRT